MTAGARQARYHCALHPRCHQHDPCGHQSTRPVGAAAAQQSSAAAVTGDCGPSCSRGRRYLPRPPSRLARANAGHLRLDQLKVMSAIENCRTAALGGHVDAARTVHTPRSPTTVAVTGTALSARRQQPGSGSKRARPTCCRCLTSTWYSRCQARSPTSPSKTRRWSTTSCSRPQPRPCSPSQPSQLTALRGIGPLRGPIPGTWAPTSPSPPFSTPGAPR